MFLFYSNLEFTEIFQNLCIDEECWLMDTAQYLRIISLKSNELYHRGPRQNTSSLHVKCQNLYLFVNNQKNFHIQDIYVTDTIFKFFAWYILYIVPISYCVCVQIDRSFWIVYLSNINPLLILLRLHLTDTQFKTFVCLHRVDRIVHVIFVLRCW